MEREYFYVVFKDDKGIFIFEKDYIQTNGKFSLQNLKGYKFVSCLSKAPINKKFKNEKNAGNGL